jgi:membrane-bound lytic murein transglycosylase B
MGEVTDISEESRAMAETRRARVRARIGGWVRARGRSGRARRLGLAAVIVLAALAVPGGAAMQVMSARAMADLSRTMGEPDAGDTFFDDLEIDEPTPDEVVAAGFAPDPGFFSDAEISGNLGASGIPQVALDAYVRAEDVSADRDPECGIRWSLLAAIGRVESDHGRFGGAQLRADGYGTKPIRGLPLDGRPGLALVRDTDKGSLDGDAVYDRAVGPMQIIPSTWRNVGVDGNDDDRRDPNNIFDAAWGAGVYLCAGNADLTDPMQEAAAVRRYNHTDEYVRVVISLAAAYENSDYDPTPGDDPDRGSGRGGDYDFDDLGFDDGLSSFDDSFGFEDVTPGGGGGTVVPTPRPPSAPPAPKPAPRPTPSIPAPKPQPPAPTTTTPKPPAPRPTPSLPPTTRPTPPTTRPTPPTPTTTTPPTTAPPTTTPVPTPPTTAPDPGPTPPTTVPTTPPPGDPAPGDPGGGDVESDPPASVGWSRTMLDFVTETVAARQAACPAPAAAAPAPAPAPAPEAEAPEAPEATDPAACG